MDDDADAMKRLDPNGDLLSRAELRERGWTDAAIRRFLGEPDQSRPNPHYRRAAPMRLYSAARVHSVETSEAFAAWLDASTKRSARAKVVSDVRRAELLASIDAWNPRVVVLRHEQVRRLAVEAYNERDGNEWGASEQDDPVFVERIMLNYVRHELTDYEEKLATLRRRPGTREAYERGRQRLAESILEHYPLLRAAYERQEAHRAGRRSRE